MLKGVKIALNLTDEQEHQMWKSAGVARWCYNYAITRVREHYRDYLEDNTLSKTLSEGSIRKELTVLKNTTHPWLKEVGSNVIKQAVKDWGNACSRFCKNIGKAPKYKSKTNSKPSFYVNYETLRKANYEAEAHYSNWNALQTVFLDGELLVDESLATIRERLYK